MGHEEPKGRPRGLRPVPLRHLRSQRERDFQGKADDREVIFHRLITLGNRFAPRDKGNLCVHRRHKSMKMLYGKNFR